MSKDISFSYIIKGILKKAEKSMIKNDRKTLRKKSERLVFLVVLDC